MRFEDVSFGYPGGLPVLSDVSFTAQPGTSVALVGHTGAGKTTTMALLQRLWDPTEGQILIDGQNLRHVTLDSLRRSIGVVFQESMLFNRSIRDNLRVGNPDATDERIERACRMADAHEFIVRQPQGYDTMIGERGATLSGGQRQRLAIARALLKDPPILILDEATSALDAATEARVGRALKTLMAGRTTFIIAHRLSTVRDADEILVFDAGRIVERGSFNELLARNGQFVALVEIQLTPASGDDGGRLAHPTRSVDAAPPNSREHSRSGAYRRSGSSWRAEADHRCLSPDYEGQRRGWCGFAQHDTEDGATARFPSRGSARCTAAPQDGRSPPTLGPGRLRSPLQPSGRTVHSSVTGGSVCAVPA